MKQFQIFSVLGLAGLFVAHYLVFIYAPMEVEMRAAQRIFYFHVPSAWLCFLGFIVCFGASIGYLVNRKAKYDLFAYAAAEVGLLFGAIVLTTGPLWARATWGVWWRWEPRLTSMALLVLIFAGYWVLRTFGRRSDGVRKFAAVLAVFGTPNIFFVHYAVKKWKGDHPDNVQLDPEMRVVLYSCLGILMIVFWLLLVNRYRAHRDLAVVGALKRRLSRL